MLSVVDILISLLVNRVAVARATVKITDTDIGKVKRVILALLLVLEVACHQLLLVTKEVELEVALVELGLLALHGLVTQLAHPVAH